MDVIHRGQNWIMTGLGMFTLQVCPSSYGATNKLLEFNLLVSSQPNRLFYSSIKYTNYHIQCKTYNQYNFLHPIQPSSSNFHQFQHFFIKFCSISYIMVFFTISNFFIPFFKNYRNLFFLLQNQCEILLFVQVTLDAITSVARLRL